MFFSCCATRISRLFNDAKKILLYTQNDKSYEGYIGMLRALRKLQKNTAREDMPLIIRLLHPVVKNWPT